MCSIHSNHITNKNQDNNNKIKEMEMEVRRRRRRSAIMRIKEMYIIQ